jgi:hypothetical protein
MATSRTLAFVTTWALIITSAAAAQVRRAPGTASNDQVTVAIAVQAGTDTLHVNGKGTCTHAPRGSVFGTLAQMWSVQGSEGQRSAALTVWKTSSGANMFSLALSAGEKSYTANTAKGPAGGDVEGSGAVTFAPDGAGGTFTVNAVAGNGAKIAGTFKCDAFTGATAEGGD